MPRTLGLFGPFKAFRFLRFFRFLRLFRPFDPLRLLWTFRFRDGLAAVRLFEPWALGTKIIATRRLERGGAAEGPSQQADGSERSE